MIQGKKYQFSFDAYATAQRSMIVDVSAPDKGYKRYLQDTSIDLTTEKQTYTLEFDMTDSGDVNGRVEFNLGNQGSTADVYISNVCLKIIGEAPAIETEKSALPDGNYVYNGEFQEGSERMDYWSVNKNDDTNVSVTNNDNIRELKVEMANVTNLNDVVVKQESIAISKNKDYVLSFFAYADGDKSIQAKIAGQSIDCQLTTVKTKYTYRFTTDETIDRSDLEFLLGQNGTIYLDDVRVQEDSMLINGDFSSGMTGYELYAYTPSDVSHVIDELNEDMAIAIDINNTGDADWKIQLKQNDIKLEKDKWYRIRFEAKATADRKIMYALQRDGSSDDDWTPYSGSQIVELTSQYQTFVHEFKMNGETDLHTILSISMGAVEGLQITDPHTVVIDNIQLEEIDEPVSGGVEVGTQLIENGNFAQGESGWSRVIVSPALASADFSQAKAQFSIQNVGELDWNVQLKKEALMFEQGSEYQVSFKIKSSEPRTIKYALLDPSNGYTWYGGADIVLNDSNEYQVDNTLVISQETSETIEFVISMGKIENVETLPSTIEISDISIVKVK